MTALPATLPGRPRGRPLVEGEFPLEAGDFAAIAAMLRADSGIALPEAEAVLVYSRLAKRLRALGLGSFRHYCALIAGERGAQERRHMLTALTTNVTRFFREPHHFEHLRTVALPPLLQAARHGARVRVWSAACSTGQEPYSIAMSLLSAMPDAAGFDVKVLATDIDPAAVAEGREGRYAEAAMAGITPDLRQRWFNREDGGWRASEGLRHIITFRELNLIGQWPMRQAFHAVMCRNVAIYFDDETQATLWSRFAPLVEAGGHLYIGHSERVGGPAARCFEHAGLTTYRKRGAGGAP
jgi:chemotaxis protein methyltransferase CheR